MDSGMDASLNGLLAGAAFVLVLSLWAAGVVLWRARKSARQEKVQRRLDSFRRPRTTDARVLRLWRDGKEATTLVPNSRPRRTLYEYWEEQRLLAGFDAPLWTLALALLAGAGAAAGIGYLATGTSIVAAGAFAAVLLLGWIAFRQRIARQKSLFEGQLSDALDLAARSLRAGHPLVGSFRLIAEEIPAPVGPVFAAINQQQGLGVALDEALRQAAERSSQEDLKLFATSVIIQVRSGGNLADMMERLAEVIRDRQRLARRIRVLTTQTQFSKRVLLTLPLLIFVLLSFMSPNYMLPLYTTDTGRIMLGVALGGLLAGAFVMNRLAIIHY